MFVYEIHETFEVDFISAVCSICKTVVDVIILFRNYQTYLL